MSSFCTICEIEFSKKANLDKHLLSEMHNKIFNLIQKNKLEFQIKLEERERELIIEKEKELEKQQIFLNLEKEKEIEKQQKELILEIERKEKEYKIELEEQRLKALNEDKKNKSEIIKLKEILNAKSESKSSFNMSDLQKDNITFKTEISTIQNEFIDGSISVDIIEIKEDSFESIQHKSKSERQEKNWTFSSR